MTVRYPALVLLLAIACTFRTAGATDTDEHTDVLPSTDTVQTLRDRSHPESALDRWHERLFFTVQDFIAGTDARFVDDGETPLPTPVSPFRIGLESDVILHDDRSLDLRPRADVDLVLKLPNLERRLSLFVTSDKIDESPRVLSSASSAIRAGLRLTPLNFLDFDLGVRADVPPVAFASLRWQRDLKFGLWSMQPLAKVYAESDTGFGIATGATFDRWQDHWVFRSASYANWRKDTGDTELTQSFTLAHAQEIIHTGRYSDVVGGRDFARGYGLQLLATGTHDTGAQRYEASLFFKRPTQTRWLYWHAGPLVSWERPYRWHPDPGIRVGIDALFWDVSNR